MTELKALVGETLTAMDEMTAVLDRETGAIRQAEWSQLSELQAEKVRLARLCESRQAELDARAEELRAVVGDVRGPLELAGGRLSQAIATNLKALEIAKAASSRIVALIVETAKQAVHPGVSYDRSGRGHEAAANRSVHLRLNESL